MFTATLLSTFVIFVLFTYEAEACSKRRPPPPPPPPPPPGSPPPPAPPPPIVKVIRQREQVMSRNNCKQVQISTLGASELAALPKNDAQAESYQEAVANLKENEGASDQCINAENFEYRCEFSVFSEIALTVIYHPTGCGCAFTIQVVKPRPRKPAVANLMAVNAAYDTKVTKFSIVVYDIVADKVETDIPAFRDMTLSDATRQTIEAQVAKDPNGDFASITAAFAGKVKSFPKLPEQLNKNNPANKNYVPAIMFSIEQKYRTGAMFKVPCKLKMHTAPNAFMSVCQPFRPDAPNSYAKRYALEGEEVENSNDKAWFREFYLFPKQKEDRKCAVGYEPKSRYITSYYNDVDCDPAHGYMSFDREFTSTFTGSKAVVGGWTWKRDFTDTHIVYGVPKKFSALTAVWCLGFSQITWSSPSAFAPTKTAINKKIMQGEPTVVDNTAEVNKRYGEKHKAFKITGKHEAAAPAYIHCNSDSTLLGFQNDDPRDFEKRRQSTLLTGPRKNFCTHDSQEDRMDGVEFDTLTFRGVKADKVLTNRKRSLDADHPEPVDIHMVYDPETQTLRLARHAPHLAAAYNRAARKRGAKQLKHDPVAAPPHRDNFALNTAAGSVDIAGADGARAGDHPLRRFPETYSAPLTLDPVQSASEDEPLVYNGKIVTGVPPKFCDIGDLGCTCRDANAISACDHPYECNSLNYCVRPACPPGKAGCDAHSDGSCEGNLIKGGDGKCVYKHTCNAGDIGCVCDKNACSGNGQCLDGFCIRPEESVCTDGEPGCPCNQQDGSCSNGSTCDEFSGVCLFESCRPGSRGCRCNKKGNPCSDGFVCNDEQNCVESKCVPGDAGCQCLSNRKCNVRGFTCVELTRDGSQTACVGEDLCSADQTQRCIEECGPGNVAACGKCSYSTPICRDERVQYCNPKSYLYKVGPCESSASTIIASMIAVVVAFVAMF